MKLAEKALVGTPGVGAGVVGGEGQVGATEGVCLDSLNRPRYTEVARQQGEAGARAVVGQALRGGIVAHARVQVEANNGRQLGGLAGFQRRCIRKHVNVVVNAVDGDSPAGVDLVRPEVRPLDTAVVGVVAGGGGIGITGAVSRIGGVRFAGVGAASAGCRTPGDAFRKSNYD